MKLETFFEKFDQFADASDAVGKMRELVLDLAVRGRLFGKAVEAEADGLPTGWHERQLGEVAQFINGDRSKNYPSKSFRVDDGVPFINAGHLSNGDVDLTDMDYITPEHFDRLGGGKVERGDVLYCLRGSLGKCAVVQSIDRGAIASSLLIIRPSQQVASRYIYLFLTSPLGARMIAKYDNGSAQPNLSAANVKKYILPLPPLAEQKRIVAKVDELMALCDRLEAQQQERETRHASLARASLARFADAPTPANLPFLFHPSYAIRPADLRKSILALAVQGKLVPFDTDGEEQTVGDHIEFQNGYAFKSEWFKPSGMRLCRNLNVSHGNLDWRESAFVDDKVAKEFERFALGEGDIVLSLDRPLIATGLKVARVTQADLPCLLLQRVAKPVPKHDQLDLSYFMLWLNSSEFVDSIDPGRSNGVPHISTRQVQRLPFVLPPLAEQRRIVAKVEQLMALVDELETQLAASRVTAANLLSALVAELTGTPNNGKISVPSASVTGRRGRPPKS
jgi:type I restriction enzyme S subunit